MLLIPSNEKFEVREVKNMFTLSTKYASKPNEKFIVKSQVKRKQKQIMKEEKLSKKEKKEKKEKKKKKSD